MRATVPNAGAHRVTTTGRLLAASARVLNGGTPQILALSQARLLGDGTSRCALRICPTVAAGWLADPAVGKTQAAPASRGDPPGV